MVTDYDDYENIDILKDFLNATGACEDSCDFDSLAKLLCSPFDWQNGVCNQECNLGDCDFDGGDCNQLCQYYAPDCYSFGLFENGICDVECNTTYCNYDNYQCVTNGEIIVEFDENVTICNIDELISYVEQAEDSDVIIVNDTKCLVEWVDDLWCDNNCLESDDCFNDANDCTCTAATDAATECEQLASWYGIISDFTSQDAVDTGISRSGACAMWDIIEDQNWDTTAVVGATEFEQNAFSAIIHLYVTYFKI